MPSNTCKWETAILVISCLVHLCAAIGYVDTVACANDPSLPALPIINWDLMESAKQWLFPFFLVVQVLQWNESNALHLAFCWRKVQQSLDNALAIVGLIGWATLETKITLHHQKIVSSGVYHIALALFPSHSILSLWHSSKWLHKSWKHLWKNSGKSGLFSMPVSACLMITTTLVTPVKPSSCLL